MAKHARTSWSAPEGEERCGSVSPFLPLNFTTCLRETGHDGPCHHELAE